MWVAISAGIGAVASLATTVVGSLLKRPRPDYFDEIAKKVLLRQLKRSSSKWNKLSELRNTVGLSNEETKQILLMAGAVGKKDDPTLWGLEKRAETD